MSKLVLLDNVQNTIVHNTINLIYTITMKIKKKPTKGPKTKTNHHDNQIDCPWCTKFSIEVVTPTRASFSTTSQSFHRVALFWYISTTTSRWLSYVHEVLLRASSTPPSVWMGKYFEWAIMVGAIEKVP